MDLFLSGGQQFVLPLYLQIKRNFIRKHFSAVHNHNSTTQSWGNETIESSEQPGTINDNTILNVRATTNQSRNAALTVHCFARCVALFQLILLATCGKSNIVCKDRADFLNGAESREVLLSVFYAPEYSVCAFMFVRSECEQRISL